MGKSPTWRPMLLTTSVLGVVFSVLLISSRMESTVEMYGDQLWSSEGSPTTQLPTWRVTGTLDPVIGGVDQVVGVPPASSISAPLPASISSPGAAAAPQPQPQGQGAPSPSQSVPRQPAAWVPPPKPWEPLGKALDNLLLFRGAGCYFL
jgi:hypothetical protein